MGGYLPAILNGGITLVGPASDGTDQQALVTNGAGELGFASFVDAESLSAAIENKADLVDGLIPTSQIPAVAITEFLGTVASEEGMLALDGQSGDWCNRSDVHKAFVIIGDDPSELESWAPIDYPAAPVLSVNGQAGTVVLAAADVGAATAGHTHSSLAGVTFTGQVLFPDGSTSATGIGFANETGTGFSRTATGTIEMLSAGNRAWQFTGTLLQPINSAGVIRVPAGSASSIRLSCVTDTNTGIYFSGSDGIGLATGGVARLTISDTGVVDIPGSLTVTASIASTGGIVAQWASTTTSVIGALRAQAITAATAGVPVQNSPALRLTARVWDTTAVADRQTDFYIHNAPTSGVSPTSVLNIGYAYNNGSITTLVSIAAAGVTLSDGMQLVLGTSTGTKIGTSVSQKLGFHNATPTVQRAGSAQAAVATTAATQSTPWGFASQSQADAIVTLLNEIRAALVEKGLIKGSA
ncbi:hypothetical protein [Planctomicrobium sp. SH664]|uniref:hypothetical protein n=1 Tax=Planctomicrobium sp. SH664 TaxID=3448125 RepID=UPI003F5C39C7